jgi:hypothetical protein
MAVQFSVAYSSIVKGSGIVAAGLYCCVQGNVNTAAAICSCTEIPIARRTNVQELNEVTDRSVSEDAIDPVSNLSHQRIWMFSGTTDSVVPQAVMNDLQTHYRHCIAGRAHDRFFMAQANGFNQNMGFDSVFTIASLKRTQPDPIFMLSVPALEQAVKLPLLFRQQLYCINTCMCSLHRFMYNNLQNRTSGAEHQNIRIASPDSTQLCAITHMINIRFRVLFLMGELFALP